VERFKQVDATYKSDLRELNEFNVARFDAKRGPPDRTLGHHRRHTLDQHDSLTH